MLNIQTNRFKPPYLIHSDLLKTKSLIKNGIPGEVDKRRWMLQSHFNLLSNSLGVDNLIFPCFNYDFPKTAIFDLQNCKSQVGPLTNFILESKMFNRTKTPIFSFLSRNYELSKDAIYKPYNEKSVFEYIYNNDGSILLYGADIRTCTFLHYIESQFGPPLYRYDKTFSGKIIDNTNINDISVEFHVRPNNIDLEYDWDLLLNQLIKDKLIYRPTDNATIHIIKARELYDSWGNIMLKDPLGLLDSSSKYRINEYLSSIGRRFLKSDFE